MLLMGVSNLVADGLSMGVGDYLSSKAELDFAKKEAEREWWEMGNYQQGRNTVGLHCLLCGLCAMEAGLARPVTTLGPAPV